MTLTRESQEFRRWHHDPCYEDPCVFSEDLAAIEAAVRADERRLHESAYDEAAESIHAAFCNPDEQVGPWDRDMAEALRRRGLAIVRAEQAAEFERWREEARRYAQNVDYWRTEVERLRATMEKARVTAMTMLLGERVCEKSHRDGERNAHVHVEVVHGWAVALAPFARAALAATPVAPAPCHCGDDLLAPVHDAAPQPWPTHRPTPVAPAPAATERWTLVPGEDDDCPRCGRVKLRWVPPEYEPGGWVCDDCGWDSRDSRSVAPAPAATEQGCSTCFGQDETCRECGGAPTSSPAATETVIRHGDEHDDPDGFCATCEALGIGPYEPEPRP